MQRGIGLSAIAELLVQLLVNEWHCVLVSEADIQRTAISSFKDVSVPDHLSSDSEGHVLVADCYNDRILLLNSQLQLQRVLVDT